MSVRPAVKNGRECWLVEVYLDGKRIRRFRDTEQEARRTEVRILEGIEGPGRGGRPAPRKKSASVGAQRRRSERTLEEFAPVFLKRYAKLENKPSEYDSKESKLRVHLVPQFGDLPLSHITAARIADYVSDLVEEGEIQPKTINNILTVLNMCLKKAQKWNELAAVPAIPWLEVDDDLHEFKFLDFEPAAALLESADEPMWGEMILVAMKTGLRLGELRALRPKDVDLERKVLHVRKSAYKATVGPPKTRSSKREMPLTDSALRALKRRLRLKHSLVFCNEDGSMLTKEQCKWPLWRACDRAGIERKGWHVLRHTFASHLAMRGRTLKEIQELMGHTTIKMTLRYARLSPEAKRDAVMVLDEE